MVLKRELSFEMLLTLNCKVLHSFLHSDRKWEGEVNSFRGKTE